MMECCRANEAFRMPAIPAHPSVCPMTVLMEPTNSSPSALSLSGKTKGLTMPSGEAQAALIRETYRRAGLDPSTKEGRCQFFEAHGTGTPAGDPQEAKALDTAFFPDKDKAEGELLVGSIKTVIGHTEGCAGIAGILKASLALQHSIIPPNLWPGLTRRWNP